MSTEEFAKELKISGLQYLRSFDYPQMPQNFPKKVQSEAEQLARLVHYRIISINDAFHEIKTFVSSEFSKIYCQDY